MKIKNYNLFLIEKNNVDDTDKKIHLIKNNLLEDGEYDSWEDFVNDQSLGDCQYITNLIEKLNLPGVVHCIGEIELDEPYYSIESDSMEIKMVHHWVKINGTIFDFSKGTLKYYLEDQDLDSVEVIDDWRYNEKYCR